jgi:hypothetical protein
MRALIVAAVVALAPSLASARDRGEFLLAPRAGVLLPYGFSALGPSYLVGVEVGWALPVVEHRLAVTVAGDFTAPEASGSAGDARLDASSGAYTWHLSQREVILGLSLVYRHPLGRVTPYAGLGPRLFLLDSRIEGNAGAAHIAQSHEQSTQVGGGAVVGLGVRAGPGDLFAELRVDVSRIDHRITGPSNTGALAIAAGYRVTF